MPYGGGQSGSSGSSGMIMKGQTDVGDVSVAVISHNYGCYLAQCLDSVLLQSFAPKQVIVIDDRSTDNTKEVALSYADRGVEYIAVDTGNVWENRLTAFNRLNAKWVLCLDADNYILPGYLEAAVTAGKSDDSCGIVYSSLQRFGNRNDFWDASPSNSIWSTNYIDAGAVFRREAVLQEELESIAINPLREAEDWLLARKIVSSGWKTVKNPIPLMYRIHDNNKQTRRLASTREYYDDASLRNESVTIVVPLSGRHEHWSDLSGWLDQQQWPRHLCRLMLMDNSHDPEFSLRVREFLNQSSYTDFRYVQSALGCPGLSEKRRAGDFITSRDVNIVVASHYNRSLRHATTEFVFTLEDDVIPYRLDVIEKLLRSMRPDVAGVTGAYRHRDNDNWLAWKGTALRHRYSNCLGVGDEDIDGCGFGCLLLRKSVFETVRLQSGGDTIFFDCNACDLVRRNGWRLKINWDVVCDHRAHSLV